MYMCWKSSEFFPIYRFLEYIPVMITYNAPLTQLSFSIITTGTKTSTFVFLDL